MYGLLCSREFYSVSVGQFLKILASDSLNAVNVWYDVTMGHGLKMCQVFHNPLPESEGEEETFYIEASSCTVPL